MSQELSLNNWNNLVSNEPLKIIFKYNNIFLKKILIILIVTIIYPPLIFLSLLLFYKKNDNINQKLNNNIQQILKKKNHYGYYENNEIGSIITDNKIADNKELINKLIIAWNNNDSDFIIKILNNNLTGTLFFKLKKDKITYRVLVNAQPLIKIIARFFVESINTDFFEDCFLNFQKNGDNFMDCCKLAVKHRVNKNKQFIQLDLTKAFDNLDRNLIEHVLNYYNVDKFKIIIIMKIIKDIKIKYNNRIINHRRGVLQGITFSNLIFGIVVKYIYQKIKNKLIKHKLYENINYQINFYVDDIIIRILTKKRIKTNSKIISNIVINTFKFYNLPINKFKSFATKKIKPPNMKLIKYNNQYLGMIYSKNKHTVLNYIDNEMNNHFNFNLEYINDIPIAIDIIKNQNLNNNLINQIKDDQLKNHVYEFYHDSEKLKQMQELKIKSFSRLRYKLANFYGCVGIQNKKNIIKFLKSKNLINISNINFLGYN
tara:strand:+ start:1427 stop:2884 length:1458 start_codon:yes stop_codon:yes gene_type:complete